MYCMQVCDVQKTLYGLPLEPLPDPVIFDDCGEESCSSETPIPGGPTGRGCLFDQFDPNVFNKPCCKSGCCAVCSRIGEDAPYLVPHVISCMMPWDAPDPTCSAPNGTGRCLNHSIEVIINALPSCRCMPTTDVCELSVSPNIECATTPHSTTCCIRPQSMYRGYQVLCIRVRGVPTVEYDDYYDASIPWNHPAFINEPDGYELIARVTLHLEILLKDCCGYIYTVKSSYRLHNNMLLRFPLHCRLCELGEANIYLRTKVQLCDDMVIEPEEMGDVQFHVAVNLAVDACIVRHIPYDACNITSKCLPSLVNGAHNISDPDDVMAIDTPYLVPFPVACRRIRSERTAELNDDGVPIYKCVDRTIPLPATLPGMGPWTVLGVTSSGTTDILFDDCVWPKPGQSLADCTAEHYVPCDTYANCISKQNANCDAHTLKVTLRMHLKVTLRDSLGDTYVVDVNFDEDASINMGTAWKNLCRGWLYIKTKFALCGGSATITGGGSLLLPVDMRVEACVMKLIPYQITGRDPNCNLGPWYYKDYCKYPLPSVNRRLSAPLPPTPQTSEDYDCYDEPEPFPVSSPASRMMKRPETRDTPCPVRIGGDVDGFLPAQSADVIQDVLREELSRGASPGNAYHRISYDPALTEGRSAMPAPAAAPNPASVTYADVYARPLRAKVPVGCRKIRR